MTSLHTDLDLTDALTPTPATAYRVARWRHTRWIELHPAHPTDVYLRPEGGTGAHALYARCRDCAEALLPETFESIPPPSVEDVARAMHAEVCCPCDETGCDIEYVPEMRYARAVLAVVGQGVTAEQAWDEGYTAGNAVRFAGHPTPRRDANPYRAARIESATGGA